MKWPQSKNLLWNHKGLLEETTSCLFFNSLLTDSESYCCCSVQFSSVAQSCPTLCNPMNRSRPGLPVNQQLSESTQTHVHRIDDAIQPSHPLSSPSPLALYLSQHQDLFKWVSSSHQVAKVLEFQLQHQFYQWTPKTAPLKYIYLNSSIAKAFVLKRFTKANPSVQQSDFYMLILNEKHTQNWFSQSLMNP